VAAPGGEDQEHNNNNNSSKFTDNEDVTDEKHKVRKTFLIYIMLALLLGLADLFYRDPLYALTLEYVPLWQSQYTRDSSIIQLTRAITYLGEGYAAAIVFTLSFVLTSRDKAFYIIFVHAAATTINKNLKIIYRNPRPYMVSPELTAFGCSKSFGNPSGHSSLSACLYVSIFLLTWHDHKDHYKEFKEYKRSQSFSREPLIESVRENKQEKKAENSLIREVTYVLSILLTAVVIISVGLSRVALGVHSFNQIVYGWSYGVWLAFFLFHYARPVLQVHIRRMLAQNSEKKKYAGYYFSTGMTIWLLITVFQLFNFLVARRDFQLPPP